MGVSVTEEKVRQWQRWTPFVPFVMLGVASVLAVPTAPFFGAVTPRWVLVQVALVTLAAAWTWWFTIRRPAWREDRRALAVHFVGRTVIAFVLTWINPFFALFAWVGFLDVHESLRGRWRWLGMAVVAATVAGSQSGGLPPASGMQWVVIAVLMAIHIALVSFFATLEREVERRGREKTETIAELEQVNAELEAALRENAALHATLVERARQAGVQEERQRLALEIHDTIAQTLAASLAQLQAAQTEADPRGRLDRITALTRAALAEARRSVLDLAPEPLAGTGLAEAVGEVVSGWSAGHDVRADLVVTGDARPLHPEVESTVVRVAQEALANVAKHAGASRVGVTLTFDDDEVILDVRDDGAGFDPTDARSPSSFGLRGMRQRAERLAGELHVESGPGLGTAVSARLPALARDAAA